MPTVFNGFASSAGALLAGETSGLGIDFLASLPTLYSESSNTLMNYFGTPFTNDGGKIDFSRASLATTTDVDGKIKWAPHNLVLASEQFDNSNWSKTNVTVTANYAAAPNGTTTADRAVYVGGVGTPSLRRIDQAVSLNTANVIFTFGIWVSGTGKFRLKSTHSGVVDNFSPDYTATTTPTLYTFTVTNNSTNGGAQVVGIVAATDDTAFDLNIWGAHLYRSDLGGMQANGSAYPYYNSTTAKNLAGFSEDFTNANWAKSNTTVPATKYTAPNGSLSANLLVDNNATSGGSMFQGSGITWTSTSTVVFDLSSTTQTTGTVTGGSFTSTSCTPIGDGWCRLRATKDNYTASIYAKAAGWTGLAIQFFSSEKMRLYPSTSGTSITGTGDGTNGVYIWGAQWADSNSLDPYVPNFGAAPSAAAYYGPRIDYDAVNLGTSKGLLIEEQRTNLALRSQELGTSPWAANQSTVTVNTGVAPDGTTTADLLAASGAGSFPALSQAVSGSGTITFSAYVKDGTSGQVIFRVTGVDVGGAGNTEAVYRFTFSTAIFARVQGGTGTTSVQALSNNWYRISLTLSTTSYSSVVFYPRWSDASLVDVLLWGAQLEAGSFATSYIPTAASTVTRSGDAASVGSSLFALNTSESSMVVLFDQFVASNANVTRSYAAVLSDTGNLRFNLRGADNTINTSFVYGTGSTVVTISGATVYQANTTIRAAMGAGASGGALFINGSQAGTNASALSFTSPSLQIGCNIAGANQLNGHVRQISYIPRRLSDAELQAKTSA